MPIIDLTKLNQDFTTDIDKLLLLSGEDVPIKELKMTMHQPRLFELAMFTEKKYLNALSIFNISTKEILKNLTEETTEQERQILEQSTDFDLVISFLQNDQEAYLNFNTLLLILFPQYEIEINLDKQAIIFKNSHIENSPPIIVNRFNYNVLVFYVREVFSLNKKEKASDYNTVSKMGERIAEKLRREAERKAKMYSKDKKESSLLCNAISSLVAGSGLTFNVIFQSYTLLQLYDQLLRFRKYEDYHQLIDTALAGAPDVDIINWMDDI